MQGNVWKLSSIGFWEHKTVLALKKALYSKGLLGWGHYKKEKGLAFPIEKTATFEDSCSKNAIQIFIWIKPEQELSLSTIHSIPNKLSTSLY